MSVFRYRGRAAVLQLDGREAGTAECAMTLHVGPEGRVMAWRGALWGLPPGAHLHPGEYALRLHDDGEAAVRVDQVRRSAGRGEEYRFRGVGAPPPVPRDALWGPLPGERGA